MPIREYRCSRGHVTEEIHSLGREPVIILCYLCGDERRIEHAHLVKHSVPGRAKVEGGTPRYHKQAHKTDIDHRTWSEKAFKNAG